MNENRYIKHLLVGCLFFFGGIFITIFTMNQASKGEGGTVYITYGFVIYGFISIIQGFSEMPKGTKRDKLNEKYYRINYPNGDFYIGPMKDGLRDGLALFQYQDGQIRLGYWKKDLMEDAGVFIDTDNSRTTGFWINGKFSCEDEVPRMVEKLHPDEFLRASYTTLRLDK